MTRWLFSAALALVLGGVAWAVPTKEEKQGLPKGPAPRLVLARVTKDKDGIIELRTTVHYFQTTMRSVEVVVGGKKVTRLVQETVPVVKEEVQNIKVKDIQISTAAGKKVDANKLPQLLKKKTPVLISADGREVDPFYLQIIKEKALVLVLPPAPAAPSGAGGKVEGEAGPRP